MCVVAAAVAGVCGRRAAGALRSLAVNGVCRGGGGRGRVREACGGAPYARGAAVENGVSIAAAGGIKPLIALLGSPSAGVQEAAVRAVRNLAVNGVCRGGGSRGRVREACGGAPYARGAAVENGVAIAAAGGIEPLIALLGSPSEGVQEAAANALWTLAFYNGVCRSGVGARACNMRVGPTAQVHARHALWRQVDGTRCSRCFSRQRPRFSGRPGVRLMFWDSVVESCALVRERHTWWCRRVRVSCGGGTQWIVCARRDE